MDAAFVADPFVIRRDGQWWMFFEVLNDVSRRGEIGCARSPDGETWSYVGRALREPFHLSYPHVFESDGDVYMIPESHEARAVRLYRAVEFPCRWVLDAVLVEGIYCDSTVFQAYGMWWMFAMPNETLRNDELHLLYAERLRGPWRLHPQNPVVRANATTARPAGRCLVSEGRIIRFAQSCVPLYGSNVSAFEVTALSEAEYAERVLQPSPLLAGSGVSWNADGMHHIDIVEAGPDRWLACVDGWRGHGSRGRMNGDRE
jgi:hypothetical protein